MRCGAPRLLSGGNRFVQLRRAGRATPWLQLGGLPQHLAVELEMGLYGMGQNFWSDSANRSRALSLGEAMENYANAGMAPLSRCKLWMRFRADLEYTIKEITGDKEAKVLVMGGLAQGMATVDGDVDLAIFLPSHIAELQQDRSATRLLLHTIGRGLKRQGFDGFVVPARVPIIQYRPDGYLEELFALAGSDELFRFLRLAKPGSLPGNVEAFTQEIKERLGVAVRVHKRTAHHVVFEFPLAADAFSCMYRFHRKFAFMHLSSPCDDTKGVDKDKTAAFARLLFHNRKLRNENEQGIPEEMKTTESAERQSTPGQSGEPGGGLITIDDILKTASRGKTGNNTGVFTPYPFAVDISVSTTERPWGPRNSELLRRYLSADPKVRVLAMYVKWWSKHSVPVAINNSRSGWLTSYCVLVMLIHFLIREGRLEFIDPQSIAPVLTPDVRYPSATALTEEDHMTIVHDFMKFAEYYAVTFDYKNDVITLVTGEPKTRDECSAKVMSARNTEMIIEDPYEDRSLGHPIDSCMLVKIRAAFLAAARATLQCVQGDEAVKAGMKAELREKGHGILEKFYDFANEANVAGETACAICKAEPAVEGGSECVSCEEALEKATIPLDFFAQRTKQEHCEVEVCSKREKRRRNKAKKGRKAKGERRNKAQKKREQRRARGKKRREERNKRT